MATKKSTTKTVARKHELYEGVGFDATAGEGGHGFANYPAVAVAVHPMRGIQIVGPFKTAAAASIWIDREGDAHLVGYYGEVKDIRWHVESLDVPRSY